MSPFYFSQPFQLLFSSLLVLLVFHIPTSNAQGEDQKPLNYTCESTTTYSSTSTFATNLKLLLPSLSSNSSLNRGFYNGIIGQAPNTVYGQALCRGDSDSDKCQNCINKASDSILSNCSTRTAAIWYDTCQLRYSDTNFFGNSTTPWWFWVWSMDNITGTDLVPFKQGLERLMKDLANKTEAQPWLRNFVTGQTNYASFKTVYGLMQCVPDISATDCHTCLTDAISFIPRCCDYRIGGRVIGHVCGLRFESTAFSGESKVADPAPSPPPSTNAPSPTNQTTSGRGRGNIILILVPTITGAIILSLMVALLRIRKTQLKK